MQDYEKIPNQTLMNIITYTCNEGYYQEDNDCIVNNIVDFGTVTISSDKVTLSVNDNAHVEISLANDTFGEIHLLIGDFVGTYDRLVEYANDYTGRFKNIDAPDETGDFLRFVTTERPHRKVGAINSWWNKAWDHDVRVYSISDKWFTCSRYGHFVYYLNGEFYYYLDTKDFCDITKILPYLYHHDKRLLMGALAVTGRRSSAYPNRFYLDNMYTAISEFGKLVDVPYDMQSKVIEEVSKLHVNYYKGTCERFTTWFVDALKECNGDSDVIDGFAIKTTPTRATVAYTEDMSVMAVVTGITWEDVFIKYEKDGIGFVLGKDVHVLPEIGNDAKRVVLSDKESKVRAQQELEDLLYNAVHSCRVPDDDTKATCATIASMIRHFMSTTEFEKYLKDNFIR